MTVEQHQRPRGMELMSPVLGLAIGAIAAAVMAAVAMVGFAITGQGLWTPLNAIGGFFGGSLPPSPAFAGATTVLGITIQLVMGALLGALYATAAERMDTRSVVIIAVYYGFGLWFVSTFLVFSWLNPAFQDVAKTWPFLLGNLAYGLVLAAFAATRNKRPQRATGLD